MDLDAKKIIALKDELRKDLEALERVERLMAAKNGSLAIADERKVVVPISLSVDDSINLEDEDDNPASSLKGTIENIVNADISVRWTNQKMLAHMQQTGFKFRAKKPIYSVGQAMTQLADTGKIRIVRRGVGNQPNIYKGKPAEQPSTEGPSGNHEGGEKVGNELTVLQ